MDLGHFRKVNPNTVTAPVYRGARDRELATALYDRLPVLVNRSTGDEIKAWPVRYATMFHMANDSALFRTPDELADQEAAWPEAGGRWRSPQGIWIPLYEGKMVQAFDHRASGIATVKANLHRTGQAAITTEEQYRDANYQPEARYFVRDPGNVACEVAIKDVTSTTNARSLIACIIPEVAAGHTLPIMHIEHQDARRRAVLKAYLVTTLNSLVIDFVLRTKILGNHASWYMLEQLSVVPPERFDAVRFGPKTAGEIIREAVLELTYTAHDMAPFARDIGYVGDDGDVKPPFVWDNERRRNLRAKLDAVYFHLYGVTGRDDLGYIYSTFPLVEQEDLAACGRYRSRDLCLA
jgi:hypothetical protein